MASELVRQLGSDDVDEIVSACKALSSMNIECSAVAKLLSHKEPRVQVAAAEALRSMEGAEAASSGLAQLLGGDCYVRVAAAKTLKSLGAKAQSQAAAIGKLLRDSSPGVVAAAAYVLTGMGPAAADYVSALEAALANDKEDISTHMLAAAGVMPKTPEVLRKPACAAAHALGVLGGPSCVGKLLELLNSKDPEVKSCAIHALTQIGAETDRLESQFVDLLKDPNPSVVSAACRALGTMNSTSSSSTAAAVAELLRDPSPMVKASAVDSIAAMGDEAEAFLDPLCKLFNDKSSQVRCAAVKAVAGCGELGQMYASEVCRLTGNADAKTRAAAIHALTEMGERGACFDDEVEMCLSDPDPFVASAAQKALQHFQGVKMAAAAALQDLSKPLKPQILGARSSDLTESVKMLSEVKDLPSVQEMLSTAHTILGYDILKLCLEGPEETLEQTKHCQPAMYIGGLAAFELLKKENPKVAEQFQAVAGLSLGEYTALTVAGVMDFETGLRLVKFRGEAMQEAAEASPQKMISVAGLSQQVLEQLCSECRSGPDDVCQVANFLFPNGFSCAGSESACEKLLKKAGDTQGCLQAKALKTSGAFHTKCMAPARSKLLTALKDAESKMKPPNCEVYVNLTGQKIPPGTSVPRIIELLADQLTNCVLWEPAMKAMVNDGISEFYECGPMKQLKAMMKRIDGDAWKKTQNIHV
ncbi:unnamed protein product [Durusdinium trenchii]|uniref:Malonyl-CoA:ACP transacylase (MAT) domain-containing protein n=1 Tax=Durusdinium trenchii TaxID=1381693 RepID=A0ABP0MWY6_9DINO